MKRLLLVLLFPVIAYSQEVTPVLSKDYLELIQADTLPVMKFMPDTMNNFSQAHLLLNKAYYGFTVGRIRIKQGVLTIQPEYQKVLYLTGQFNTRVEVKRINRLPAVQNQYVQGRSENGALVWRGAETGEPFSYGPAAQSLEYDGGNYAYDANGKLVAAGTGNGRSANNYNNPVFRTASMLSQSLRLNARIRSAGNVLYSTIFRLGHSTENTFIKYNKNTSRNASATLDANLKKLSITAGYSFLRDELSNSNRNGFLNRVYQNAMLKPVSFDNVHNARQPNAPQTYSPVADNAIYLLLNNGNRFVQTHQTGSLIVEKKTDLFKFRLTQSVEHLYQLSREGYKPGSVYFPTGIAVDRNLKEVSYLLDATASYDIHFDDYRLINTAGTHYKFANNRSVIRYSLPAAWRYQRSAQEASLFYDILYKPYDWDLVLKLANKMYVSNTVSNNNYFLPNVSGAVRWGNNSGRDYYFFKLSGSWNRFNSELPVGRSYSTNSLLQLNIQQAFQFFPVTEVKSFDGLKAIQHNEWNGRVELGYKGHVLYGNIFSRTTANDVFPVMENNQLVLRNIAAHRNSGVEVGFTGRTSNRYFNTENTISYFVNRSKVTAVNTGYDYTPLAGFSNIHTAIVKGAALGSIVGTAYQRDANNNILIGSDGFPLVNNTPTVIGNPIPDFVMKMINDATWKMFSIGLCWEWRKGGQIWNGTQAMLDYYGRSASSAELRNTTGYIFAGVLQDKQPNTQPVGFYDVNKPVEQNRWTRYGHNGIGEEYIQEANVLRLNNINVGYKLKLGKYERQLAINLYAQNLVLYSSYKGADPNQLMYDLPGAAGLDFFNLPSVKSFGCNISIQF